tara:strand:+ start:1124 stop:1762 length:639 start_codon:yes stop_codon:yes gene_type:complete
LEGARVVVVGGGSVAARKVNALLAAQAEVFVVAPELSPELEALAEAGWFRPLRRGYRSGDLEGAFLAVVATDQREVNALASRDAIELGLLLNCADDPARSNFFLPSVLRRGDLSVAISTGGASPALAARLRRHLEELLPPEYGQLVELLAELRARVREEVLDPTQRRAALTRLANEEQQLLEALREHGALAARDRARDLLQGLRGARTTSQF